MIDRDEVLHVSRLAKLRLSDVEQERMQGELSHILDHIDRIGALDLEDVEPTTHVIALENVLRPDEPHESLAPEVALAPAPDSSQDSFRAPSPQAETE